MDTRTLYKKYIYFPQSYEPRRAPRVIFVEEVSIGGSLKGNTDENELRDGRFEFFPYKRCQIYSPRLWEDCQRWVQERDQLDRQFDQLMKKGMVKQEEPDYSHLQEI